MTFDPKRMIRNRGQVDRRQEADVLARESGDLVIVRRGVPRSVVIACPDGCGELLTINLDSRTGPAWKFYEGRRGVTLFPSVWRDDGCKSHFMLWHDAILWCDRFESGNVEPAPEDGTLQPRVHAALSESFRSVPDIATELDEIPWEVGRVCRQLARAGTASEGKDRQRGHYRLA